MSTVGEMDGRASRWLGRALGVESPFPWQLELLRRMLAEDQPPAVDVPTGLGKTAVMACWLVARALGANVPRRLVYVVDRRAVVDQATDVALSLRRLVDEDAALKAALGLVGPLAISTLRGQFTDNREWLEDPSAPAIVLGTVDMVGSRLLFEGYGVSRKMRPYHAGLLGADTLLVLDEAHLVPPFQHLIEAISGGQSSGARGESSFRGSDADAARIVAPLRVLSLSATGRDATGAMTLTDADRNHPVVSKRLAATKALVLREEVEEDALPTQLAAEAWELTGRGTRNLRCIIFCNSRDAAQKTVEALWAVAGDATRQRASIATELFVGERRMHEREAAAIRLAQLGFIAGQETPRATPTFVVATSAGEVGVDLDADHMVSDLVAWERMVQRLGRVNRRGDGSAHVIVVPTAPDAKTQDALAKAEKLAGVHAVVTDDGSGADDEADSPDAADEVDESGGDKKNGLKADELARVTRHRRLAAVRRVLAALPPGDDSRDASPGALTALKERSRVEEPLRALIARASTPEPLRPALTRAHVEAWSMTSIEEHPGRPDVAPWIRGWVDDDPPQTSVVWREQLPLGRGAGGTSGELLPGRDLDAYLEAAPAHALERVDADAWRVFRWLGERVEAALRRTRDGRRSEATPEGSAAIAREEAGEPSERAVDPGPATPAVRRVDRDDVIALLLPAAGGRPQPVRASDVLNHRA